MKLSQITYYPIKSIAGIHVEQTEVEQIGLKNDRQMMLVDSDGNFITQRKYPQLALIGIQVYEQGYKLTKPNSPSLTLSSNSFTPQQMQVTVWGDKCQAYIAEPNVNDWFSEFLGFEVKLAKYNFQQPRPTDQAYSNPNDIVSFADGFPLLVISQESLNDLNQRLELPVSMTHFRPNLVIEGVNAYAEDNWKQITIGNVTFDAVKPCSRCVLTTVDPQTGKKDPNSQPLKTLSQYRKTKDGVIFGMNLIPRSLGTLSVNDRVIVE